jgi:hypothetical protein
MSLYQWSITLCSNRQTARCCCPSSDGCASPATIVGHVANALLLLAPSDISGQLLLPSTIATGYMTSNDHCSCWARGTRAVATSAHSSDESSDISGPLLLPLTVTTGYMTSDDHCYNWAHDTWVAATSPHSSDGSSDISGPLLLPPIVVMGYMTSDDCCYCGAHGTRAVSTRCHSSDRLFDISGSLLLLGTWHTQLLLGPTVVTGTLTLVAHCYLPPQ